MSSAEADAGRRASGLVDERSTLWRGLDEVGPLDVKVPDRGVRMGSTGQKDVGERRERVDSLALVMDFADALGIGVKVSIDVKHDSVSSPRRLPELEKKDHRWKIDQRAPRDKRGEKPSTMARRLKRLSQLFFSPRPSPSFSTLSRSRNGLADSPCREH